ncbi:MAG: ribose 5-phosphate isomerase A [Thermoproteota archaeon]|nr:ribose 5-phosphate isomerase A [Thermoproteota archaeon]
MDTGAQEKDWIPRPFQQAAKNLAQEVVQRFVRSNQVIGLGSGPMAAAIVREMAGFDGKKSLECIPTSFQITLEAQRSGLKLVDVDRVPETDVVFDGADQVDGKFNMIKGGGGALLREKIVHLSAKQIIIAAESSKFLPTFTWPVPIEIHPFAIHIVRNKLVDIGGKPEMRMLKEGYPYVTENGNFILDTFFNRYPADIRRQELELKNIAGVIEVGLFTKHANAYYKAKEDGSFESIENP